MCVQMCVYRLFTTCCWHTGAARIIVVPSPCLHTTNRQFYVCMCVCVCQINENLLWQPQRTQKERVKAPHSALGTRRETATQMRCALICPHVEGWDVTKFYSFNGKSLCRLKRNPIHIGNAHTCVQIPFQLLYRRNKLKTHPYGELNHSPTLYQRLQLALNSRLHLCCQSKAQL